MTRYHTADEVRKYLQAVVQHMGSQKAVADAAQVAPSFLSDVLKGRREPTGNILSLLRMERTVHYIPNDDRQATRFECVLAGVLLSRGEPLSFQHEQAIRDYLGKPTDAELHHLLKTGWKYP